MSVNTNDRLDRHGVLLYRALSAKLWHSLRSKGRLAKFNPAASV